MNFLVDVSLSVPAQLLQHDPVTSVGSGDATSFIQIIQTSAASPDDASTTPLSATSTTPSSGTIGTHIVTVSGNNILEVLPIAAASQASIGATHLILKQAPAEVTYLRG